MFQDGWDCVLFLFCISFPIYSYYLQNEKIINPKHSLGENTG